MGKQTNTLMEYRKLDLKGIEKAIGEARLKLQDLRNQLTIGKLKSYSDISKVRQSIAKMETVRNEKIILEAISHGQN